METAIVPMSTALIPATARLYGQVFSEPPWNETWTTEATLQAVNNPLLRWWVAMENGKVIGFVAGCVGAPEEIGAGFKIPDNVLLGARVGYLAELGVAAEFRRDGLARRLTTELTTYFREEGVEGFAVRTRPGTGNYPWYLGKLEVLHKYTDGRTLFGCSGIPSL